MPPLLLLLLRCACGNAGRRLNAECSVEVSKAMFLYLVDYPYNEHDPWRDVDLDDMMLDLKMSKIIISNT